MTSALYHNVNDYKRLLLEFGLNEKSKSIVNELSGGQKQKLFVLLALIIFSYDDTFRCNASVWDNADTASKDSWCNATNPGNKNIKNYYLLSKIDKPLVNIE